MNSPKGSGEIWCFPKRVSISWHPSWPQITGNQSYVTISEQSIQHNVTQRCQICEQGLYDDHSISEK